MGFEHVIAAWLVIANERKREKKAKIAAQTLQSAEKKQESEINTYLAGKGYNCRRQQYLTGLAKSALREDRKEFLAILGRPYCAEGVSVEWALRAIADREGWTYYRKDELIYDEEYCRILGWLPPCREVIEEHFAELEDLRRKECIWRQWVAHNPKCWEVKVTPEFYESEEQFAFMVEYEYDTKHL